jgi:hypothetical protein
MTLMLYILLRTCVLEDTLFLSAGQEFFGFLYKNLVNRELIVIICNSKKELNDSLMKTNQLSLQRYFIMNGEQCNKAEFNFKKTDSLVQIKNKREQEYLVKLAFLYTNPTFENLIFSFNQTEYTSKIIEEIIDLSKDTLETVYHKSLISVKRYYVLDKTFDIEIKQNFIDVNFFELAEKIGLAYQGVAVNHEIFSKALLELFPEFTIEQDSSFLKIRSDIKHLINNHNIINKNKQSLFKVYYNVNNENKNSILFFDKEADVKSYSYVLRSLDGLVVYLNI